MSTPDSDRAAIRQVIRALRKAGYTLTGGHDGEDFFEWPKRGKASEDWLIDNLTACDDSTLHTWKDGEGNSHVYFVLGNDPEEVVCDYGVSLEPVIGPLTEGWWS